MIKVNKKLSNAITLIMATSGLYLFFCGITAQYKIRSVIDQTMISISQGDAVLNHIDFALGLISNGHLSIASPLIVHGFVILGSILMYLSFMRFRARSKGLRLRDVILRRHYWTKFHQVFDVVAPKK